MAKQKTDPVVILPAWMNWVFALTSFILVPLFLYKPAIDVTLVPKFMVLSSLLLFYVLIFLVFGKYKIPIPSLFKTLPVIFWAGFILISVLSLFVAINPHEGFFDILRIGLSFIYLIITASLLIRTQNLAPFLYSAILITFTFIGIGFYEYFTEVFRHPDLDALYKVKGLMSHKNIFSGVLFLLIPFLYISIFQGKRFEMLAAGAALLLDLILLLLLQTRSIWLAIMVFIIVSACLGLIFRKGITTAGKGKLLKSVVLLVVIHLLAFSAAYFINRYSIKHPLFNPSQPNTEMIKDLDERVGSIFNTSSPNRMKRISVWRNTLDMIKDYPVLGVGAGNWKIWAPNYYQPDPHEGYYHNWRRPHNDFLWVFAEKGVLGMLVYLGFFVSIFILAWKALRKTSQENHKILVIFMLGGLAGYLIDASFSFPYERIDLQMFMMFYVAVILWIHHTTQTNTQGFQKMRHQYLLLGAALLLITGLIIGRKMVKGEVYTNYSYTAHMTQNWPTAVYAIDLGYSSFAQLDPSNNPMLWFRGSANMRQGKLKEAQADLEKALKQNPYSLSTLTDLGTVHFQLGNYDKAIEIYNEATRIFPMQRFALRIQGMSYAKLLRWEEALVCYYRCMTDKPDPDLEALIQEAQQALYSNRQDSLAP